MIRLFLYGTLLEEGRLAGLVGRTVALRAARLSGWRRVGLLHGRYPTLRRGGRVDGAVAEVNWAGFRRLAIYEGPQYRVQAVRVRVGAPPRWVSARVWIAGGGTGRGWALSSS